MKIWDIHMVRDCAIIIKRGSSKTRRGRGDTIVNLQP